MRFACLGAVLCLAAATAQAQTSLTDRQAAARKDRAALREQIDVLRQRIETTASSQRDADQALKDSEQAISDISRRLDELDRRRAALVVNLRELETAIGNQNAELEHQRDALARQLQAQYSSGLSPWTALLSGEDPQRIGRDLAYLAYVSKARTQALDALRHSLDTLAGLQTQTDARRAELEALFAETAQQKKALEGQQDERRRTLQRIQAELQAQRGQARELEKRDARLGDLIKGLDAEIAKAEARRQAALRAEAERKAREAREAREAAERARQVREQAERHMREAKEREDRAAQAQAEAEHERALAAERAEAQRARAEQARQQQEAADARGESAAVPAEGFPGLSKGLPYPVKGEVQGRFGAERPDGGVWRGIVLRAAQGTDVRAVAAGRVVYAHWLSGFGNILIIDHGRKYLSVYAYNQSLLRQVGDVVGRGDVVARVGATGGQVEPGLYFELRHDGAPINPQLWLAP
uniref:murein hydrolase activator EnvC family protein n=1 Tax=Castellaniella defragrans TaxID=75697 RepID=UPI00333F726F